MIGCYCRKNGLKFNEIWILLLVPLLFLVSCSIKTYVIMSLDNFSFSLLNKFYLFNISKICCAIHLIKLTKAHYNLCTLFYYSVNAKCDLVSKVILHFHSKSETSANIILWKKYPKHRFNEWFAHNEIVRTIHKYVDIKI